MAKIPDHIVYARQLIAENKKTKATTLDLGYKASPIWKKNAEII